MTRKIMLWSAEALLLAALVWLRVAVRGLSSYLAVALPLVALAGLLAYLGGRRF